MAGDTEANVRARLDKVREDYDDAGPKVIEELCTVAIRLAHDVDEIRADLVENRQR